MIDRNEIYSIISDVEHKSILAASILLKFGVDNVKIVKGNIE